MSVLYFAYGSNMDEEDLERWCRKRGYDPIKPLRKEVAVLRDWRLVFNYYSRSRCCGVASIIESPGNEVWGLLMELTNDDFEKIREKEGAPLVYEEIDVSVETRDGRRFDGVKTFRVREDRASKDHVPPSKYYLGLIINAAKRYGFPESYVDMLERVKTLENAP